MITTLFPHLSRHHVHQFRWALVAGLAVVVALVGGGLIVASILVAAVLVPVLYLVYLYEAQVYRDEPAKVLGLTMVAGVALGVVVSIVADAVLPQANPIGPSPGLGFLVGATIVLPLIQEILKPLPVLALRGAEKFAETIDGLTFGVACGLGFAAAETIVQFSRVLATEPVHTSSANWLFPVLGLTVVTPLLQATCTGALAASLWRPRRLSRPLYTVGLPLALGAHVAYSAISQLLQDHGVSAAIILFFQAAIVAVMLVYIRHVVHDALFDEATDFGFKPARCPHCHHYVAAAAFCPLCGGAISAGPRTAVPSGEVDGAAPNAAVPLGALHRLGKTGMAVAIVVVLAAAAVAGIVVPKVVHHNKVIVPVSKVRHKPPAPVIGSALATGGAVVTTSSVRLLPDAAGAGHTVSNLTISVGLRADGARPPKSPTIRSWRSTGRAASSPCWSPGS
ncbi:MAG TPA: PrsW family glutamic-type intramembrane protease [Acidimicrobiales bacterium]|nr:PrsW family glutamic-type intramembrane protease [Acidimicrobiales bacterium]